MKKISYVGLVVALAVLIPAFSLAQYTGTNTNVVNIITVVSPNGGEVIKIGDNYPKTYTILWKALDSVSAVNISLDTGIRCITAPCPSSFTIATGVKNTGSYVWNLDPKVSYPGVNFRIQISDPSSIGYDSSDKPFSIVFASADTKSTDSSGGGTGTVGPVPENGVCPDGYTLNGDECVKPPVPYKIPIAPIQSGDGSGTFIVAPVNGACPANYLVSKDGEECLKLSPVAVSVVAPKVIGSGTSYNPITPVNGACPDGYVLGNDDKECLKPSVISVPQIIIAPRESFKEISFESSGNITIKDNNTNKETMIAPKEFKAVVSVEASAVNQAPMVKQVSIQSNASSSETTISSGQVSASTQEPMTVKDNKVFLKQTEVKIMPDTASETAIAKLGDLGFKIELKDVGSGQDVKPAYEAVGTQDAKLFGLFNIKMTVSASVDAQTGTVSELSKPWWSFLVR